MGTSFLRGDLGKRPGQKGEPFLPWCLVDRDSVLQTEGAGLGFMLQVDHDLQRNILNMHVILQERTPSFVLAELVQVVLKLGCGVAHLPMSRISACRFLVALIV